MWEATETFSGIAYPEYSFPALADGARCPFCQQEIGKEAEVRLRHFTEYMSSSAQAQVREAEKAHESAVSTVTRAMIVRVELDPAISELSAENPPLAKKVQDFLQAAERIQIGINEALAQGVGFIASGLTQSPEADLVTAAAALRERARQLLAARLAMTPADAAELKELEARVTLSETLQTILEEIERKKRLAAYAMHN